MGALHCTPLTQLQLSALSDRDGEADLKDMYYDEERGLAPPLQYFWLVRSKPQSTPLLPLILSVNQENGLRGRTFCCLPYLPDFCGSLNDRI